MPPLLALALPAFSADSFGDQTFYLGDLHAHSGYSGDAGASDLGNCPTEDGCGAYADFYETAKANGLDFVAMTDHLNAGSTVTPDEYEIILEDTFAHNAPADGFVTIPAGELAFSAGGAALGHKNIFLFAEDGALTGVHIEHLRPGNGDRSTVASCDELWTWIEEVEAQFGPVLLIPHHPALILPSGTDWSCHDPTWEPTVEVHSAHGNSLWEGVSYDPPWSGTLSTGTVHHAMDPAGHALRMGFVGGTDSHDTRPGEVCDLDDVRDSHPYGGALTIVALDSGATFDRAAIYDAIVARRTFATSGPLVPVDVRYFSGGAALGGVGQDLGLPAGQDLQVRVEVPAEWERFAITVQMMTPEGAFTLAKTSAARWEGRFPAADVPAWLYPSVAIDGASLYRGSCDDGGSTEIEWIWGSPSWIDEHPGDLDGDGVSWADGDCDDGAPDVHPAAEEAWYDGVDQDCDGGDDFDQDGDGVPVELDCADDDPNARPGGTETWYDGIDGDCDERDDYDQDGDGSPVELDCGDTDPVVHPGANEVWYDGIDQDCDGRDDDRDGDGVPVVDDCDDLDAASFPGATETWYDGVDQDCDGRDDDRDGDGFVLAEDCDDTDASLKPGFGRLDVDCDPLPPSGRCATLPGALPSLLGIVAGLAALRRRPRA